jgi:hypothetical protein
MGADLSRGAAMSRGQRITFLAGACYLIGAFLPWIVLAQPDGTSIAQNALAMPNGVFLVSIGILILLTGLAYRGRPGRMYSLPIVILSAATAFLLGMIGVRLGQAATGTGQTASFGPGLLLAFISTIIALVGGAYRVPLPPSKK